MSAPGVNLTLQTEHLASLGRVLFGRSDVESAAYVLCGRSAGEDGGERLLSRAVVPVRPQDYLRRERDRLSIADESFVPVVKRVRAEGGALLLAHSHPDGPLAFSEQDDREEARLFAAVQHRAPGSHGSLVFTRPDELVGRAWRVDGQTGPMSRVTAVGERLRILVGGDADVSPIFDRQVRAFGPDIQRVLADLSVGVVGLGGTGSAVFEQLLRLGVGHLLLIDDDRFEGTNVNRVHGSRLTDVGLPKVTIAKRTATETGLPTRVTAIEGSILDAPVARRLRACDVVFGCTDRQLPRLVLSRLATRYLIPVIDVGALVDAHDGTLRSVAGRVTTLLPGAACLLCCCAAVRSPRMASGPRRSVLRTGTASLPRGTSAGWTPPLPPSCRSRLPWPPWAWPNSSSASRASWAHE